MNSRQFGGLGLLVRSKGDQRHRRPGLILADWWISKPSETKECPANHHSRLSRCGFPANPSIKKSTAGSTIKPSEPYSRRVASALSRTSNGTDILRMHHGGPFYLRSELCSPFYFRVGVFGASSDESQV